MWLQLNNGNMGGVDINLTVRQGMLILTNIFGNENKMKIVCSELKCICLFIILWCQLDVQYLQCVVSLLSYWSWLYYIY